jgi:hypothetical protein
MTRSASPIVAILVSLLLAGPAAAAPIAVNATLRIDVFGFGGFQVAGSGSIDVSGGVYTIPAGLLSVASLTVPVTTTSAVNSLVVTGIGNLAGTFAPLGVTTQAPAEICPVAPLGQACVSGGGLGGIMALTGVINMHVVPHVLVIPVGLFDMRIGQGGSTGTPFTADGAPWTTGTARIGITGGPVSTLGGVMGGSLSLVSATRVFLVSQLLPTTARLTLTPLVPEPTGLTLVAIGVAGLVLLARSRR